MILNKNTRKMNLLMKGLVFLLLFVCAKYFILHSKNGPTIPERIGTEPNILNNIKIKSTLNSDKLDFIINNNSYANIKDLIIKCEFNAQSGTRLEENEYVIYNTFNRNSVTDISDYIISDIPKQSHSVACTPKEFSFISGSNHPIIVKNQIPPSKSKEECKSSNPDLTEAENEEEKCLRDKMKKALREISERQHANDSDAN